MDEDGVEAFDINEDDLERALNPGTRRHFQSKNQATYGIWADKEGSDEEDRGFSFSNKSRKKNFAAPVNFVSGGVKVGNSMEGEKEEESTSYDDPVDIRPPPKKANRQVGANVMAGMRMSANRSAPDSTKFAGWVAPNVMKMMEKMGYKKGEGLGATGQGIIEPVVAAVRAGRGAVGAYGKEATGPKFGESAADAQKRLAESYAPDVEEKEPRPAKGGWKKTVSAKTSYKTIEDVIQEGGSYRNTTGKPIPKEKVIDMTGREQRVYSGYDSFSMKTKEVDLDDEEREAFDVPELRYNLNLLLDMTEESIRKNDNLIRNLKDETTALEYDLGQLRETAVEEETQTKRIEQIYDILDKFNCRTGNDKPTIGECQQLITLLMTDYKEEFKMYSLETVAIPCVLPQLIEYFSNWRPLDPNHLIYGIDLMKEWKAILVDNESRSLFASNISHLEQLSAYDRLLWEGWMPSLRSAALSWNPKKQVEEMLRLIETWLPVLPTWMKENLLEQIIIPRIATATDEWDPITDSIPIHSWIIPWLVVLGDRLQPVIITIRQKLGEILQKKWNPSDVSAVAILVPWVGVWEPVTMAAFLARYVVPKLERALDSMPLDPQINSSYGEFKGCLAWLDIINPDTIANVLTKYFFPRWYELLCGLLDSGVFTVQDAKQWYMDWSQRIPQQLAEFPTVKENLKRAMIAIAHSAEGRKVSTVRRAEPTFMPPPPQHILRDQRPSRGPAPPPMSLKETIEAIANRNGLTYIPQRDRFKEGRQVYWFGSVSIYMDGGAVYSFDTNECTWNPTNMDQLLLMAGVGV